MGKLEYRTYSGAEILLPQAVAACEAENYENAETICLRLLEKEPDNADANNLMCVILTKNKQHMRAIRHIAKAIEKETDRAQYHANLAKVLLELKEYDKTLMACDKTLSLKPDCLDAYATKAGVYREQGDVETAKQLYQQALSIDPKNEQFHNLLGNSLSALGEFNEALNSFKTALHINPNSAQAYTNIVTVSSNAIDAEDIGLMETLFGGESLRKDEKITLGFGLGKAFEKAGDYDKAFHYFSAANNLMRESTSFDVNEVAARFQSVKEVFNATCFQEHSGSGCQDDTPIFILGMPRSGTTLTEQILSSHSQVYGAGELTFLSRLVQQQFRQGNQETFPDGLKSLSHADLERIGGDYSSQLRSHSKESRYITDKMPGNFLYVGLIKMILPNAKVIYCKREPADICLSIYKNHFSDSHLYATDQMDLGVYTRHFRSLMAHWDQVLPGFMHTVVYEDMVADLKGETRRLLEFCNLPWEEKCLAFYEKKRPVQTISMAQVRKPIYTSSVGLWKQYEKHLAPLLEELQKPLIVESATQA